MKLKQNMDRITFTDVNKHTKKAMKKIFSTKKITFLYAFLDFIGINFEKLFNFNKRLIKKFYVVQHFDFYFYPKN